MNINENLYPNLYPQVSEISTQIAKEIRTREGYVNVNDAAYEATEQQRANALALLLARDKNNDAELPEVLYSSRAAIKAMLYHLLSEEGHEYISYMSENLEGIDKRFYRSLLNARKGLIHCGYAKNSVDEALRLSSDELDEINHPEPEDDECLVD